MSGEACSFCCDYFDQDGGIRMDGCEHSYCLICIEELVNSTEDVGPVLRCQIIPNCPGGLDTAVVKCLLGEDVFEDPQQTESSNPVPVPPPDSTNSTELEGACALTPRTLSTESDGDMPEEINQKLQELMEEIAKWKLRKQSRKTNKKQMQTLPKSSVDKAENTKLVLAEPEPEPEPENEEILTEEEKSDGWYQLRYIILEIQKQHNISYEDAEKHVDSLSVISTRFEIECILCTDRVHPPDGVIVKDCLHMFCRNCLRQWAEHSETAVEITCPFVDGNYRCDSCLKPNELKQICSVQLYSAHYEDLSVRVAGGNSNMKHCLTPGCPYFVEVDDHSAPCFECPNCGGHTCIRCQVSHPGQSCEGYAEEIEENERRLEEIKRQEVTRIERLAAEEQRRLDDKRNRLEQQRNERLGQQEIQRRIQTGHFKPCPNCGTTIEKNAGCDHMTCRQCRYEFYWSNGQRYAGIGLPFDLGRFGRR